MSPGRTSESRPTNDASLPRKLFEVGSVTAVEATAEDGPALQALLESCGDYFELTMGVPPGPAEARSLFLALPDGKTYEDKQVVALYSHAGDVLGVMDVVRDYPGQGDWWLGLMLLHPRHRGRGLGVRIYHAFELWARTDGARAVFLGVKAQNERAFRFWQRLGFRTSERKPARLLGARESVVLVMQRQTDAAD